MKRYLRKWTEYTLTIITLIEGMLIIMIDDFELSTIPVYLVLLTSIVINVVILKKYGRGLMFKKDE